MTEAEWMACTDAGQMLDFLGETKSERQARLFAVACFQTIDGSMIDERGRTAVEVAERLADGVATSVELKVSRKGVAEAVTKICRTGAGGLNTLRRFVIRATRLTLARSGRISEACREVARLVEWGVQAVSPLTARELALTQASNVRDIFGSPFRATDVRPDWLARSNSTIPMLAHAIYRDRAFDRLPAVADALDDAGCDNADILAHCRGGGEHVRGCWVVDLLLGKK